MRNHIYRIHLSREYSLRNFEKVLAEKEIRAMMPRGAVCLANTNYVLVRSRRRIPEDRLRRLAFADTIEIDGGGNVNTLQLFLNRLPKLASNGLNLFDSEAIHHVRSSKREHGYLSHGLHSYKGKYYPQIVAALLNWAKLEQGGCVLDPFCGSGTTLVEATIRGFVGVGIDLNPLATLISAVKCRVLLVGYRQLESACNSIIRRIERRIKTESRYPWSAFLPENVEYLKRWFPKDALREIGWALIEIGKADNPVAGGLCSVALSDFLRDISYQDPDSLRILRRKGSPPAPHVIARLGDRVAKRLAQVATLQYIRDAINHHMLQSYVFRGDARFLTELLVNQRAPGSFNAVITSPPYATALPYIDTDRLSLFALGLIRVDARNDLEYSMIGNRELQEVQRRRLEALLDDNEASLPDSVVELTARIRDQNRRHPVGFRRRNTAALLYKYFSDMKKCFHEISKVLVPGGRMAIVIGNSSTMVAGKYPAVIETDRLLADIATAVELGFRYVDQIPMTDQAQYMRHSRNAIRAESIILLEKA